ncbi:MAG: AraC family transcriptional regulator [Anaerolineae bacterium]|nr:AraC family transcriptional regulator [Anaerolineae bacterium]
MIEALDNPYIERINIVIDTISNNLTGDLSLERLAQVAHFSPFHFHRLFKGLVGETLNQFVNRIRIERAAMLLRGSPTMNILDAAIACGYDSAAGFSRAFKKRFGIAPRQWDRLSPLQERKISQVAGEFPLYTVDKLCDIAQRGEFTVQIQAIPTQRLAYIRISDSYRQWQEIVAAHDRLMQWYQAQGGKLSQARLYSMSQDDPEITPTEKCRFDWCIAVPDHWSIRTDITERQFPACQVAMVHTQGDLHLLDKAWQYLWRYWLPRSRYQPDNLPAIEIYRRLPLELGWETFDMWCAIPIIAL